MRSLDTTRTGSPPPTQARRTRPGGHMTPLEEAMLAKAETGEWLDCGQGPFDLAAMQLWGKDRALRAAVLRDLLVGERWPVHAKGVRLRGVLISGLLDLEGATLRCPLSLDGCYLDASDPVCFDHATASQIALTRCQLAGEGSGARCISTRIPAIDSSPRTGRSGWPARTLAATLPAAARGWAVTV